MNNKWLREKKYGRLLQEAIAQKDFVRDTLDDMTWKLADDDKLKIVTGDAPGVDSLAIEWSMINDVKYKSYEADWNRHKKAAGPIRNQLMLDEELEYIDHGFGPEPDTDNFVCIAFPGGRGTADMINRCMKLGIEVIVPDFKLEDYIRPLNIMKFGKKR